MTVENMWKKPAFSNENYFCQFRWFDLVVCFFLRYILIHKICMD